MTLLMSPFDNILELSFNTLDVTDSQCLLMSVLFDSVLSWHGSVRQPCIVCIAVSNIYADDNYKFDDHEIAGKTPNSCETN